MNIFRFFFSCIVMLLSLPGYTGSGNPLPMVTVEFPPFGYTGPAGKPTGAITEIVSKTVSLMGYQSNIDTLPTKRAQQMTIKGTYSALFPVTKSKERAEYCLFSEPISYFADVFFKRKTNKISWEYLDDLGNLIVGATDGYNYAPVFLEAVRQDRLKVDFIVSDTPELQHLKKLVKGRIDLAICERSVCSHLLELHEPAFSSLDYIPKPIGPLRSFHICFSRKWPDAKQLVNNFNRKMGMMRKEGRLKEILDRYGVIETMD